MKRKYEVIKNFPGIYKVLVSSQEGRWHEPDRGSKFAVSKYEMLDGTRKRFKRHFNSFADAKSFKFSVQEIAQGFTNEHNSKAKTQDKTSLAFLFEHYEKNELIHRSINTQDKYRAYCKYFRPIWNMTIDKIDALAIDGWLSWLKSPEQKTTYSCRRCNFEHEFTFLRVLLGYYRETLNFSYQLPFLKRHRQNLKIKEVPYILKDMSPDQSKLFFEKLKENPDRYFYYLAIFQYSTFTRIQDTVALHFEDFDFHSGYVTINKKIIFRRAKGGSRELVSGAKAGQGKRIPIGPELTKIFKEWTLFTGVRSGPLFYRNGEWPTYRSIQYAYDGAYKAAGIKIRGTHVLRHASLSEAQEAGGDIKVTQMLAGHSSISMTERYAKARDNRVREVQLQVGKKIFSSGHGSQ